MPTEQHALHTCVCRHIVEVMGEQTDIEFQELLPYGSTRKTASRAFSHVLGKSQLSQEKSGNSEYMKEVVSCSQARSITYWSSGEGALQKITKRVYCIALNFQVSLISQIFICLQNEIFWRMNPSKRGVSMYVLHNNKWSLRKLIYF